MQPLTQAQIENIIADVHSPDGLTAAYEQIAEKLFGPLMEAMEKDAREKWHAARDALPKPKPTKAEFDEDMARGAYAASSENAKFICGLLLGACGLGAVMLAQSNVDKDFYQALKAAELGGTK